MQTKHTVLFEIGMEELPARFIDDAQRQLLEKTTDWLKEERIGFEQMKAFSTPRRLAIIIKGIANKQETIVEKVRGPKLDIAKDKDGNWTKAAIGFTKGQGKSVDDIFVEEIKGIPYTFVEKRMEGKNTIDVLPDFNKIIKSLYFPQTMRWGSLSFRFARPIRWLVAMMDDQVIPMEIANVKAGNVTYGHRFLGGKITLSHPDEYESKLEENYVIADPVKREQRIVEQIRRLEKEKAFFVELKEDLLNEVRNLVEYPTVFYGSFDEEFLSVPDEVLITSMREHQRYFPVFEDESKEKLLPNFVCVRNGDDRAMENVIHGNEKVLRARLADARFFYDEDRKYSIEFYMEKLKSVIFQEELGTVYDKTVRVAKLAKEIAALLDVSKEDMEAIERAASISKFDLVTNMVNEFPELQGVIGEKYAFYYNESETVARTIREHYKPLYTNDTLPSSLVASVVSVADKLDTVVGSISIGLIPTGSQDPYGLRRQAIGVLRILLEERWPVAFETLIEMTKENFKKVEHEAEIMKFFKDRAAFIFHENGIERDVIEAVLHDEIGVVSFAFDKALLLSEKRNDPTFKSAQEAFVRILNMANKADEQNVEENRFQTPSEKTLYAKFVEVQKDVETSKANLDAHGMFGKLETLAAPIHEFFDHNMVMDPDEAIRKNRLALVNQIAALINGFANLAVIEWKQHQ